MLFMCFMVNFCVAVNGYGKRVNDELDFCFAMGHPLAMFRYLQAEISSLAVGENLKALRAAAGPGVKLCASVKCNCYGHGLGLLLPTITAQADCLAVATPAEAVHVRRLKYLGPLLLMFSPCSQPVANNRDVILRELIRRGVTVTVVSQQDVDVLAAMADKLEADVEVHVMVDTGMGREGVRASGAAELVEHIARASRVGLTGIYTHLATSDELDKTFARQQISLFTQTLDACDLGPNVVRHAANSAGALDLAESHFDMLRVGLAVYGYQPGQAESARPKLTPALRLTGQLMQVKEVPAGSRCGYGLTFECTRPTRLGLVPIGYGDGYLRCLSGLSQMRIGEQLVPVVGRISMDQTIVDLTDAPAAALGDVVEIISPDPADPHSVENLAKLAGTIPYEITTRLGHRVRRKLV